MSELQALVARLDPLCRRALEKAAERALGNGHTAIEIEHLLLELATDRDTDLARTIRAYGLDEDRLGVELRHAVDGFKRGGTRTPVLSELLVWALKDAWSVASLNLGQTAIRSGAILLASLTSERIRPALLASVPSLAAVPRSRLEEDLPEIMRHGGEDRAPSAPRSNHGAPTSETLDPVAPADESATPSLDAYTTDLTAEAVSGRLDPIIGREEEIRQLVDVLMRRRQNNPILVGDAGVGKTAVVEGLALRIAEGAVPASLAEVRLHSLDLGRLLAGAGVKGEFEHRLKSVIAEVVASPRPIVLFIDEAHMLVGAGGQAGQGDAANLLKPALARGELRTIAATTWAEYKRYFEKDPALSRRFQAIRVAEPAIPAATAMLRGLAAKLEQHHRVRILEEAVVEAVRLAQRYVSGRQLPDSAIGVLDTAAARVAIARSERPAALEDLERRCAALSVQIERLRSEEWRGFDHAEAVERLQMDLERAEGERDRLWSRFSQERDTVMRLLDTEARLAAAGAAEAAALQRELGGLRLELELSQEEERLVPSAVDARAVAEVVAGWTGIPVGRMLADQFATARTLRARMGERIVGQHRALDTLCRRIQTFYAELGEPQKPTGVFLLVGPSGVGKTETAATLANLLFGGERALVSVNMSEYQEAHSVSGLKGAPPGYVGYGKGGVLTEAIRRRPYCVLLLDEVEKAHPDVLELFYQIFDKGQIEDSEGQLVNFANCVILLTSNAAAEELSDRVAAEPELETASLVEAMRPTLSRHFPSAFLGRLVIVPYRPLRTAEIEAIAALKLGRLRDRFQTVHRAELSWDEDVVRRIARRAGETDSGARNVDAILTETLLPELSMHVLDRLGDARRLTACHVSIAPSGELAFELFDA